MTHLDSDGDAVGDHVVDGRALLGALHDLAELLLGRVAADPEGHADVLEPVAGLVVDAECTAHVHVAGERRLNRRELHLARRGYVHDRGGQTCRERVQQVLRRVRAGVGAEQNGRLARVDLEALAAARVLAARRVEVLDRRAVVRTAEPAVGGTELELRQLRLLLDQIERGEHPSGVDAIADRVGGDGHWETSCVVVVGFSASSEMLWAPYFSLVRRARSLVKR